LVVFAAIEEQGRLVTTVFPSAMYYRKPWPIKLVSRILKTEMLLLNPSSNFCHLLAHSHRATQMLTTHGYAHRLQRALQERQLPVPRPGLLVLARLEPTRF
jgi:hypothetical protein